jgi:hypothetical protein
VLCRGGADYNVISRVDVGWTRTASLPPDRAPRLGWLQEQMLLTLRDRYQAIEARADPDARTTRPAHGIQGSPRELVPALNHPNLPSVVGHAGKNLEHRQQQG